MTKETLEHLTLAALLTARTTVANHDRSTCSRIAGDVRDLVRAAKALARHAENECNRPVTERETRRADRLEKAVHIIAARYGLRAEVSGDPRGYVVKLDGLPTSNELGGLWGVA